MKTLSYYKQLRDDYACIIPKTAPAYELIEALDALIAHLTPHVDSAPGTRIIDVVGVSVPFPEHWDLVQHTQGSVLFTLHDRTRQRGHVCKTQITNHYVVSFDGVTRGDFNNLPGALCCLSNASVNVPAKEQPHFLGVPVNLPKGWTISIHHDSNTISLLDHNDYRIAVAYRNINGEYVIWWEGKYKTVLKTQKEAIQWLNDKANNDVAS